MQVLDLIAKKAAGEEFELPALAGEQPKIVDLMAALEASVEAAKASRGSPPEAPVSLRRQRRRRRRPSVRSRRPPASRPRAYVGADASGGARRHLDGVGPAERRRPCGCRYSPRLLRIAVQPVHRSRRRRPPARLDDPRPCGHPTRPTRPPPSPPSACSRAVRRRSTVATTRHRRGMASAATRRRDAGRAVPALPAASALPGGVQYEQKWDGYRLVAFRAPPFTYSPAAGWGLRPELTLDAADATYALASADTFRALVEDRDWTWKRAETWITDQLRHALLPDPRAIDDERAEPQRR